MTAGVARPSVGTSERRTAMSAADNKQAAIAGYTAFSKGDVEGAMADLSEDIEWIVGGNNSVSGTYRGKHEVLGFWGKLAEKGFEVEPTDFVADGDKVVVLVSNTVAGETLRSVDVLDFDGGGKLARFETFGDWEVFDRVFST
jgi:ketosteroid isomerase-like protein